MVTTAVVDAIGESAYLELRADRRGRAEGLPGAGRAVRRARSASRAIDALSSACRVASRIRRLAQRTIAARERDARRAERARASSADAVERERPRRAAAIGVVLVSGGADSACVAAGLARCSAPSASTPRTSTTACATGADEDEAAARRLCAALRIDLHVERPAGCRPGNLQAAAREAALRAAERLRARIGGDRGRHRPHAHRRRRDRRSTGSPSRRARGRCSGCRRATAGSSGRCSGSSASEARELAADAGLPFADDETNVDPTLRPQPDPRRGAARAARAQPGGRAQHRRDPRRARRGGGAARAGRARGARRGRRRRRRRRDPGRRALGRLEPALRRLALRALAERAAGRPVRARPRRAPPRSCAWPASPRAARSTSAAASVAICERGLIRFARRRRSTRRPSRSRLRLPGRCRFGRLGGARGAPPGPVEPAGPDLATLDAARPARARSRSAPGARATASARSAWTAPRRLQDLFTDRGVPRSLRATLPVVTVGGERRLGRRGGGLRATSGSRPERVERGRA